MTAVASALSFELPVDLAASEPPEARGLKRDEVKLMVSRMSDDSISNTCFFRFSEHLQRGDVLVVNTSATINAAFPAGDLTLHLSAPLGDNRWVVELRRAGDKAPLPFFDGEEGQVVHLPADGTAELIEPYSSSTGIRGVRLWVAELDLPTDVLSYSRSFGSPIRYDYVPDEWPLSYYQTVFSYDPGSVEMPSAGRGFTRRILRRLRKKGITIVPVVLHTGVSSLEGDEPPYPERYRVPVSTARAINAAKTAGGRIVAVGTTVVRALETVATGNGEVRAGFGWTDLVITPGRGVRVIDALLTGLHAPRASHLSMLEAIASREHLEKSYENALSEHYLWHEFGDLHLLLP